MKNIFTKYTNNILNIDRYTKKTIAVITDISLCFICTWLAFVLRLEDLNFIQNYNFNSASLISLLAIPIFWMLGMYQTIFRYAGLSILFTISVSIFFYGLIYFTILSVIVVTDIPRSIGLIQPMLLFFAIIISRLSVKYLLTGTFRRLDYSVNRKNVMIYGAGSAGRQLLISLENNSEFKVIGFLDDDKLLHKQVLLGKKIYDTSKLKSIVESEDISLVLLAMPLIPKVRKNEIIKNLNKYKLVVKSLPNVQDIINDRVTVSDIKDFIIDDLLDREQVIPDHNLLKKNITSKSILVTGAGGSIGTELSRQIIKLKPKKLILIELNEFALYKVYEELLQINKSVEIIPLLCNVQDQMKLEKIFEIFMIDTIYHAAAYKHVSLVEVNICEGIKNNVFGTLSVAKASINKNVSNLVLVSSDKAVRPTNVMGASKRLSELCLQGLYEKKENVNIGFSIVRFGNVLESSGSVIPKFKQQIKMGGPVTLTHKDVTRYFMTITEAAQLVIQAGAMGKNSEVYVLDMGNSVKIKHLIYKMINMSGFEVRNKKNPMGDIEVKIIGLRPGEKLYEELLIGDNPQKTYHPRIQKTNDPFIPFDKLEKNLKNLKNILDDNNSNEAKKILEEIVQLYKSNSKIVDHFHIASMSSRKKKQKLFHDKDAKVIKII